jgi:hypothetical protein
LISCVTIDLERPVQVAAKQPGRCLLGALTDEEQII